MKQENTPPTLTPTDWYIRIGELIKALSAFTEVQSRQPPSDELDVSIDVLGLSNRALTVLHSAIPAEGRQWAQWLSDTTVRDLMRLVQSNNFKLGFIRNMGKHTQREILSKLHGSLPSLLGLPEVPE